MGNRGGGARAIPAKDWMLSPVADRCRRLVLEALRCSESREEAWLAYYTGRGSWVLC